MADSNFKPANPPPSWAASANDLFADPMRALLTAEIERLDQRLKPFQIVGTPMVALTILGICRRALNDPQLSADERVTALFLVNFIYQQFAPAVWVQSQLLRVFHDVLKEATNAVH